MFYAQLNEDGICVTVSKLSGRVASDRMIKVARHDESLLGKQYNRDTGEFEDVPQEPVVEPPTEQDIINAELLLGQAHLIESNAVIEETTALILLETVGGGL